MEYEDKVLASIVDEDNVDAPEETPEESTGDDAGEEVAE